jgi:hypothetical protein
LMKSRREKGAREPEPGSVAGTCAGAGISSDVLLNGIVPAVQ